MQRILAALVSLLVVLVGLISCADSDLNQGSAGFTAFTEPYFGLKAPSSEPELYLPRSADVIRALDLNPGHPYIVELLEKLENREGKVTA